jgi:hypothetical protein
MEAKELERLNTEHKKEIQKIKNELDPQWGQCESCRFASSDGDYGEIQCCDAEVEVTMDDKCISIGEETYPLDQCPEWKTNDEPTYCKKHKKWTHGWDYACDECTEEWVKENESEQNKNGR